MKISLLFYSQLLAIHRVLTERDIVMNVYSQNRIISKTNSLS